MMASVQELNRAGCMVLLLLLLLGLLAPLVPKLWVLWILVPKLYFWHLNPLNFHLLSNCAPKSFKELMVLLNTIVAFFLSLFFFYGHQLEL